MLRYIFTLVLLFLSNIICFSTNSKYDIVVDRNGRGHFRSVKEALDSICITNTGSPMTIYIMNGIYKEKLDLTYDIGHIRFVGESNDSTIITYDDHAKINNMGTFRTYTFKISGHDLFFENLTIENTALQLGQAVAAHIEGDRIIFKNCKFLGNQDTIYVGYNDSRQYFENCYIEGTTDFIFGPSTAWFENCEIYSKKESYITAASTPQNVEFGFVFNNCSIRTADNVRKVYLGRPWRPYAMTLIMNSKMDKNIIPSGWDNWRNEANEKTTRYIEYNNYGEGSDTSKRVSWCKILTREEAQKYTVENVLGGKDGWNPLFVK